MENVSTLDSLLGVNYLQPPPRYVSAQIRRLGGGGESSSHRDDKVSLTFLAQAEFTMNLFLSKKQGKNNLDSGFKETMKESLPPLRVPAFQVKNERRLNLRLVIYFP